MLKITHDTDEIIEKLLSEKREENGRTVYPALRELLGYIKKYNNQIVSVAHTPGGVKVALASPDVCEKLGQEFEHIYFE